MCCKARTPLRDRLARSRLVSLALGDRSYYVWPLDLPAGRPSAKVQVWLDRFKEPYFRKVDPFGPLQTWDSAFQLAGIQFLEAMGLTSGWFEVTERAQLLGTSATIRVSSFDVLLTVPTLFDPALNSPFWASDGLGQRCVRRFVPMIGAAPRQRTRARRIQGASNFQEVSCG